VKSPHKKVVLFPLKSLRYQSSSDCKRIVPGSMGANELGVWVNAPATLMSDDIYFLNPGKILQPEVKKHDMNKNTNARTFKNGNFFLGITEFNYSSAFKSTYN